MKKIKIAFIMNNLVYGGIEKFYLNYLENYSFKDKFVIDVYYSGIIDSEIQKMFSELGANIIKCQYGVENNKFKYIRELTKLFKKKKYDIVHSNLMQNDFCPLMAAKHAGIKHRISHCHMNMATKYVVYTKSKLKLIGRRIKILLTNYYSTERFACSNVSGKSMFLKKFDIVYNAIDLKKFKFSKSNREKYRKKYKVNDDEILIGFIGRLSNEKNPEYAIKIFKELKQKNSNIKMILVGTGRKKDIILNMIDNDHNVQIIDPVDNIEDYYNMFDVLIFPSISEGLGMVAIESQCNGLPIVASGTVPRETFVSNYIRYASLDDINKWIECIIELSKLKHSKIEFNSNINKFDIKIEAKELFSLYEKMVK